MTRRGTVLTLIALSIFGSGPAAADHVRDGRPVQRMVFQTNEDDPKLWNLIVNKVALAVGATVSWAAPSAAASLDDLLFDLRFVPLDGQPPPQFALNGLAGTRVSLAQFRGRVVLLYFWASW